MSLLDLTTRLKYGRKGGAAEFIDHYERLQRMIETLCQCIRDDDEGAVTLEV